MSMWLMYLVIMLDSISDGLITAIILLFILLFTLRILAFKVYDDSCSSEENLAEYKRKCKKIGKLFIIPVVLFAITTFIPNTKEAAAIYFVPKVINSKQIRKMPSKLVTLANSWMDEQIKSIKQAGK